jgi:hypothetical protein
VPVGWRLLYKKVTDDANYLSTGLENKGLAKERKIKMSSFYTEGDIP